MIELPSDIDRGMLPRSDADAADERIVLDAVLAAATKPGLFSVQPKIYGITLCEDDTDLEFSGRALTTQLRRGDEDNHDVLRATAQILANTLAVEVDVNLMLALVGPKSSADRIHVGSLWAPGRVPEPISVHHGPPASVAILATQTAAILRARWGSDTRPEALAHLLNVGAVLTADTEIAGQPLWGDRILLTQETPPARVNRWNGPIEGATVKQGWWATVRRGTDGRKSVTVGRYETAIETDLRVALVIDGAWKGAGT